MKNNKQFCILPWIHTHLNTEGDVYPCCVSWNSERTARVGWLKDNTLEELFNNDFMKQLRLDMLAGKARPDVCSSCYSHEAAGFCSARIGNNNDYTEDEIHNIVSHTTECGTVPAKITSWDIRFSNLCNLKCRTCGSLFSTLWATELKTTPLLITAISDTSVDPLEQQYENVTKIYFAGGETLIMPEHFKTLTQLIERGRAKHIKLIYNSNLTVLDYKGTSLFDYWKEFKEVVIGVSVDAHTDRAEYMRHGVPWNNIEYNLLQLMEFRQSSRNFDFYYSPTISIFNVDHLCDLHRHLWEKNCMPHIGAIQFNILHNPSYYSCNILPFVIKLQVINNIDAHCLWLLENGALHDIIDQYENLKTYLLESTNYTENKKQLDIFLQKTAELDEVRNENFVDVFPEYETLQYSDTIYNESFCIMPWIHLHAWPTGEAYLCCVANTGSPDGVIGNLTENTIAEIINNDKMKSIRKDMLAGKKVAQCALCYHGENIKNFSWRLGFNKEFSHLVQRRLADTAADGTITPELSYLDFRFSNICNYECRTCSSELSSKIAGRRGRSLPPPEETKLREHHLMNNNNVITFTEYNYNNNFFEMELKQYIDTIECFYFAGGEPLLQKEQYEILQYLDDNKWYDKKLVYSTNLSTLNYKGVDIVSKWNKFTNVNLLCSIDHFGDKLEYIRQGACHDTIFGNLFTIINTDITISIVSVISIYNIYYIDEFFDYLDQHGYIDKILTIDLLYVCNDVEHPGLLPASAKQEVITKLLKYKSSPVFKKLCSSYIEFELAYTGLITFINTQIGSTTFDDFIDRVDRFDDIYNVDISMTLPWISDVINNYKKEI